MVEATRPAAFWEHGSRTCPYVYTHVHTHVYMHAYAHAYTHVRVGRLSPTIAISAVVEPGLDRRCPRFLVFQHIPLVAKNRNIFIFQQTNLC